MRIRPPPRLFCFCFLLQVTLIHSKNGDVKIIQRTYPKKYYPANLETYTTSSPLKGDNKLSSTKLRHSQSKFPHFDEIRSRIAGLSSDSSSIVKNLSNNKRYSDTKWLSDSAHRVRHHGWSNRARTTTTTTTTTTPSPEEEDFFYNYGELNEEETEDDYSDIFDAAEEGDLFPFSVQAEEPSTTKSPREPKRYSSLTEYKWEQYGTVQGVNQARRKYMQEKGVQRKTSEESETTAVVEHYIRVKNSGQCKKPIPKVIPVQQEHPNSSVTYIPHCTVLHRCAEDTGCCKYDASCQYKEKVEVSLYFYVKPIGADAAKVKKLTFYNHTECQCKEKTSGNEIEDSTERQKRVVQHYPGKPNQIRSGSLVKSTSTNSNPESLLMKCKCPKEFVPMVKHDTKCYCDCYNENEDCLRMKKGKEYYSLVDRICIAEKECGIVTCDYGPYNKLIGRCPRYHEA